MEMETKSRDVPTIEYGQMSWSHKYTCTYADVATLREYCKVIIATEVFPKMQELGRKMLCELPPEGELEWHTNVACMCR